MRTLAEYKDAFGKVSDAVFSRAYNTMKEARHLVAVANSACRTARQVFIDEITFDWKEGYKKLKAANDEAEADRDSTYKDAISAAVTAYSSAKSACVSSYPTVPGKSNSGYLMCLRQAGIDKASSETAARKARDAKTKEISLAWNTGYKALKTQNDESQKNLVAAFKDEIQMNNEWLGDAREGLQG